MGRRASWGRQSLFYALLSVAAVAFLSVFSFYTSPFTSLPGADAAFFRLVGQGMTQGMLPYRDFFDTKGPYLFLIEYLAQMICFGRVGCFIYQCFNLIAVFVLLDRIHRLAAPGIGFVKRFLLLLPYAWMMAATFEGGNLTEEFSLPFILICVYCALNYLLSSRQQKHPARYACLYGACFGIISMIRISNAVTICALVLYILIALLRSREYRCILTNALAFIAGLVLSLIPAFAYCMNHGILPDMLEAVFVFGLRYTTEGGMINLFFLNQELLIFVYPMLLPALLAVVSPWKNRAIKGLIWLHLLCLTLALSMGNRYPHYFTLVIPHMALGFVLVAHDIESLSITSEAIRKYVLIPCVCLVSLSWMVVSHGKSFALSAETGGDSNGNAKAIAAMIPENQRDRVYTYGIGSSWYTETGLYPCIRYCDWQDHYIALQPSIQEELVQAFQSAPPQWLVTGKGKQPAFLQSIINQQYVRYEENDAYVLWSLVEQS